MGNAEGTREKKQVSLGVSDGEELGDLFSNEDVQHRDQEERDRVLESLYTQLQRRFTHS